MVAGLAVAFVLLLVLAWALAPRGVPWAHDLTRARPGSGRGQAEWTAPPEVVRAVRGDYLAAQAWLARCSANYGQLSRDLERFTAGPYLRRQQAILGLLAQTRGPRLAAVLEADRQIAVRHFSADGLRCLVVDRQSQRRMVTRRYWAGDEAGRQSLPDAILVTQMVYDPRERRWKLERLIQSLPAAPDGPVRLRLAEELPSAAGRDY
jgi:hypothetical protein